MGGDQIVAALIGADGEREHGDEARAAEAEAYGELIGEVQAMEGATELLRDLVEAALEKAGRPEGPKLMVGDSTWDAKAAAAAGVPTLAVLTGGFSAAELSEAGAAEVVESIAELRRRRQLFAATAR